MAETQHSLELEKTCQNSRFASFVRRLTGKYNHPCIDEVANATEQSPALLELISGEVAKAHLAGKRGRPVEHDLLSYMPYAPDAPDLYQFLNSIYENAKRENYR